MHWLEVTLIVVASLFSLAASILNPSPSSPVLYADGRHAAADEEPLSARERVQLWMQVFLTVTFVAASLYIILSRSYDDGTYKWAFGMSGSVFGFWFSTMIRQPRSIAHGRAPSKSRKTK